MAFPGKKGVCMKLSDDRPDNWERVLSLQPHWHYSWGLAHRLDDKPDDIEYMPMVWGGTIGKQKKRSLQLQDELKAIIDSGKATKIMGFNEPDKANQSNMTVAQAVEIWPMLEQYDLPLLSPACAGPPNNEWMKEFLSHTELRVDYIAVHVYCGLHVDHFQTKLQRYYETYGSTRPLVVTEFAVADWNAKTTSENRYSPKAVLKFMKAVIPWMERTEWIAGYAWFPFDIDRPQGTSSALFDQDGQLTACGRYYASVRSDQPDGDQTITGDDSSQKEEL